MRTKFHFYNSSLDLLTEVELNSIVDGLGYMTDFKPLVHQEDAEYEMISSIRYLDKIEASGIKHVHNGSN